MRGMGRWLAGGLAALLVLVGAAMPAAAAAEETVAVQVPGLERVKAVAAAGNLYVTLRADGTVWVADLDGDGLEKAEPQRVEGACVARAVAPGADGLAMLCADGTVMTAAKGIQEKGIKRAEAVPGLTDVKAVNLGKPGLVALRTDGTVWVSEKGINEAGYPRAQQVRDLSGVVAIAAGVDTFVAVRADGTAARMAINEKGPRTKREANVPPVRSVTACGPGGDCDDTDGYVFEAADGQLLAWSVGADGKDQVRSVGKVHCEGCFSVGHARVLTVTAGGDAQMAQAGADGRVIVTDIKKSHAAYKQVAAGGGYDLALAADGTVWAWRAPARLTRVEGLTEITAIASAGEWHLARAADGRLFCWGANDPAARTWVIPHVLETRGIAAAPDYYVTLNTDGTIATGTWPVAGALPQQPVVHRDIAARAVAAGPGHVILIKFDGHVEAADVAIDEEGVHVQGFHAIQGLDAPALAVAAGTSGYLVLMADGAVRGARWGQAPVQVKGADGARAIAAGGNAYAVLLGDGSVRSIAITESGVKVWGDPHVDESDGIAGGGGSGGVVLLADGTAVTFAGPASATPVAGLADGIAVSAAATQRLVLKVDGTVWRW